MFEVFLINCCVGGFQASTPASVQTIFGVNVGSKIYGFYWCALATSNFIGYFLVSNLSKTIGFDSVIYITLGMTIAAIPIVIFTKFQGPWGNDTVALEYCISREMMKVEEEEKKEIESAIEEFEHNHDKNLKK